jgi:YD repeat-containing protein
MDLQAFQRMMQLFPSAGIPDPAQGGNMGPGMMPSSPESDISSGLDNYQPRTAISDKLTSTLGNMPVRPEPGMLRRIGASIAGFGAGGSAQGIAGGQPIGYKYDPKSADIASDKVKYGDFDNQLNDWQNQVKALGVGANEEDRANAGEVKRLAGNAKNEIDQQKVDVANKRADAYQQGQDTKEQGEINKHEYFMQKLSDKVDEDNAKLALAYKKYELSAKTTADLTERHKAQDAAKESKDAWQKADAEFKQEQLKRKNDSTIEYNRIRSEALKSGKETDTNVTYDAAGNRTGVRTITAPVRGKTRMMSADGKLVDIPDDKVDDFIKNYGGKKP